MTEQILFYTIGIITTLFAIGYFRYKSKYKTAVMKIDSLENKQDELEDKLEDYVEPDKLGLIVTPGWHKRNETDDPNKYVWDVVFEVKELGKTKDKTKVEVVNVYSKCSKREETFGVAEYSDWFVKRFGGWVDTSRIEWFIDKTEAEIRSDKITDLLNES